MAAAPRTVVIACGALARELVSVIRLNRWAHMSVTCLPAILHNRPERIPAAVRAKIRQARARGADNILCLYGDCGTGGLLDEVLREEGVERIEGAHCYAFYTGIGTFDALAEEEIGTFYLTDYLVRHFDRLVMTGLGIDRHPELLPVYFGNYRRVVHLVQMPDTALSAKALRCAARLGLPLARHHTGLTELDGFLEKHA